MNRNFAVVVFILGLFMYSCSKEKVDLIIHNAKIYTVDDEFTIAEAMAIRGDSIVEIGAEHQILNKYTSENSMDMALKAVYPGFIDAHCHFYGYGLNRFQIDLVGTTSWQDVLQTIRKQKNDATDWIIGRGWDQNDWTEMEFPDKNGLSEFGEKPVFLKRIDGHAALVNQAALDLAGITAKTKIEGGIIEIKEGSPSGILIDNAVDYMEGFIPKPGKELQSKALLLAQEDCLAKGLSTVDDAGLDKEVIDLIHEMQQDGRLKIHVYAMANPSAENLEHYLGSGVFKSNKLTVRSFKIYADGALGSRGAKLIQPYSDVEHDHRGLLIHQPEYFDSLAALIHASDFQMNTHAIGDSANRLILNTYGKYLGGVNDRRWRIEHAQVINPKDLDLFRTYTIIPSVQPSHATSDMYWAEDRLGTTRIAHAYAYQQLLEQNGLLALGTDFPVEDINPIKTFYAACVRKDAKGFPEEGFQNENSISRQNALKGMTIWAAISNFEEEEKGSLVKGKKATFVVLDRDIMTEAENNLLDSQVLFHFIDGELVYTPQLE